MVTVIVIPMALKQAYKSVGIAIGVVHVFYTIFGITDLVYEFTRIILNR